MALGVGLIHGAAGSGALLMLTVGATQSVVQALGYFAIFGVGSIAGMALLSMVVSFPLLLAQRGAEWLHISMMMLIGVTAASLGASIVVQNGYALAHLGG